ncbi:MAG: hypothetical protein LBG28_15630 [Tannerella sp.]|jgi:ubiquinone biosynthesis protein Coq4|nr:hypothetical protein [Tannerella sp.]
MAEDNLTRFLEKISKMNASQVEKYVKEIGLSNASAFVELRKSKRKRMPVSKIADIIQERYHDYEAERRVSDKIMNRSYTY